MATENGSPEVTPAENNTVWHLINPPAQSVEAHPVRLSQSGHRMSSGETSNGKLSSLELTGGSETVFGACFTADSDDVRCLAAVHALFLRLRAFSSVIYECSSFYQISSLFLKRTPVL